MLPVHPFLQGGAVSVRKTQVCQYHVKLSGFYDFFALERVAIQTVATPFFSSQLLMVRLNTVSSSMIRMVLIALPPISFGRIQPVCWRHG